MLLITVFRTDKDITVRTTPFTPSFAHLPNMAFMHTKELVKEKGFKAHVVSFLLQKFAEKMEHVHSIVVVHNDEVMCRWRSSRGHFKELT